jgi:hypothetical protein
MAAQLDEGEPGELEDLPEIVPELPGAPPGWKLPQPADSWNPNRPIKADKLEPEFTAIDNPGNWDPYTFQPTFLKTAGGRYFGHQLPTGAMPVPVNQETSTRSHSGWEFHYQGWKRTDADPPAFRDGATRDNLFPESRKGSLDKDLLIKLGLTPDRMKDDSDRPDALFFYQLLLPICDPAQSGVVNDPRKGFYTEVAVMSNSYAITDCRIGPDYGHSFGLTHAAELLRWDGVTVMDGVRGGSKGAILRRFDCNKENTAYCPHITRAFTKQRWLMLKRVYKLCYNDKAKKKGEPGYDPAYKYDFIFNTIISNVNAITKYACQDLCGDETTYAHEGYGEKDTALVKRILNKPGVTRGGQVVLVCDVDRIRPRAYLHRHKCHAKDFNLEGPNEVKHLLDRLEPLCIENILAPGRGIFKSKPHITFDNFFSGEDIATHAANRGFGMTTTLRRDRMPKPVPNIFFHVKKTNPKDRRVKVAKFLNPIVAVKKVNDESLLQLTSFQSTSSCNFLSVNAYNACGLYAATKERGRTNNGSKRKWAIEMNDARQLYLATYGVIDAIDHLIKNCNMSYRSWKYWHAAMIRAKAFAVVISYDIYLEAAEGKLHPSWKVDKPVSFFVFRERLSIQMLNYAAAARIYPGDHNFRMATQQHKERRPGPASPLMSSPPPARKRMRDDQTVASLLTTEHYEEGRELRLCGDISNLCEHINTKATLPKKNTRVCFVCGNGCHEMCAMCDKVLHYSFTQPGMKVPCFFAYHNSAFFGLARDDWKITGAKKKQYTLPDEDRLQQHAEAMRQLEAKANAKRAQKHNNSNASLADSNSGNNNNEQQQSPQEAVLQGVSESAAI